MFERVSMLNQNTFFLILYVVVKKIQNNFIHMFIYECKNSIKTNEQVCVRLFIFFFSHNRIFLFNKPKIAKIFTFIYLRFVVYSLSFILLNSIAVMCLFRQFFKFLFAILKRVYMCLNYSRTVK